MSLTLPTGTGNVTTGQSTTVTLPANRLPGDVCWVWICSSGSAGSAFTVPAGWTTAGAQKDGTSSFLGRALAAYRVIDGTESSTYTFTHAAATFGWVCWLVKSEISGNAAAYKIGNPPTSGFSGTYSNEETSSVATCTFAAMTLDTSYDLYMGLYVLDAAHTLTQWLMDVTGDPARRSFISVGTTPMTGSVKAVGVSYQVIADRAASGNVNLSPAAWTRSGSGKSFTMSIAVTDGVASYPQIGYEIEAYPVDFPIVGDRPDGDTVVAGSTQIYGGGVVVV